MENIKEIDLHKYFIMEIPEGQKEILATIVALNNGWLPTIDNSEIKESIGEKTYIQSIIANFTKYQTLNSIEDIKDESNSNYGKTRLTYLDVTPIENTVSSVDFGIRFIQLEIGRIVREAVTNQELKILQEKQQKELLEVKEAVTNNLNNSLNNLKAE